WPEAHWELFNVLLSEYMQLERQRGQLAGRHAERLFMLDALKDDGTLSLIASIARSGFPPEFTDGTTAAPFSVSDQGRQEMVTVPLPWMLQVRVSPGLTGRTPAGVPAMRGFLACSSTRKSVLATVPRTLT